MAITIFNMRHEAERVTATHRALIVQLKGRAPLGQCGPDVRRAGDGLRPFQILRQAVHTVHLRRHACAICC